MTVDRIKVAPDVLADKALRLRRLTVDMGTAIYRDFSASGPVDEAYRKLGERWDESRTEIDLALENIAKILDSIREAFEDADAQLAAGLEGAGAAP
jgi:hypothetical protein